MNNSKLEGSKLFAYEPDGRRIMELKSVDLSIGNGAEVAAGDTITAHYTGALAKDGTVFQSSHDTGNPATFSLNQVIEGWQKGVPGMKIGGKRRLFIPSEMAYGSRRVAANIPANSDMVFDIELVAISGK